MANNNGKFYCGGAGVGKRFSWSDIYTHKQERHMSQQDYFRHFIHLLYTVTRLQYQLITHNTVLLSSQTTVYSKQVTNATKTKVAQV
jgi:hypothetical protein